MRAESFFPSTCLLQYLYGCTLDATIRHSTIAFNSASLVSE